jgi:hypothetical protein
LSRASRRAALAAIGLGVIAVAVVLAVGRSPRGHGHRPPTTRTQTPPTQTTPATPGPPAQPAPAGQEFGVNVNRLFNDRIYTVAQIDGQLQALARTGAALARSDALWEAAEPAPPVNGVHRYQWSFDDEIAGALAAHGLRWLPIIDYSAPWAQSIPGQDHSPPRVPADYAAYAAALAARYGPRGSFWLAHPALTPEPVQTYEIWNEPDNGQFWAPAPDPSRYAELYRQARNAITTVDPNARVIVGGLTTPTTFLPAMLSADPQLQGHIDGVAVHPYGNPAVVLGKLRADRAALVSLGLAAVPMYVTEFGWTTQPAGALNYAPAARRPAYITRTLAALGHLDCGIAASLLYTWVTPEHDAGDSQDWYGIHPPTGGSTPDTAAFTAGLQEATAPAPPIRLCPGG